MLGREQHPTRWTKQSFEQRLSRIATQNPASVCERIILKFKYYCGNHNIAQRNIDYIVSLLRNESVSGVDLNSEMMGHVIIELIQYEDECRIQTGVTLTPGPTTNPPEDPDDV